MTPCPYCGTPLAFDRLRASPAIIDPAKLNGGVNGPLTADEERAYIAQAEELRRFHADGKTPTPFDAGYPDYLAAAERISALHNADTVAAAERYWDSVRHCRECRPEPEDLGAGAGCAEPTNPECRCEACAAEMEKLAEEEPGWVGEAKGAA